MRFCTFTLYLSLIACAGSQHQNQTPMPDPLADVGAESLYRHGLGLAERGDMIRAEQYFIAAIERGFPKEEALSSLLQVCVASGRYAVALGHARPFLRTHPENWSLRYVVATLHLGLQQWEEARTQLETVIEAAPRASAPYYALGVLYRDHLHNPEMAKSYLQAYLRLEPQGSYAPEVRNWVERQETIPSISTPSRSQESEEENSPEPSLENDLS